MTSAPAQQRASLAESHPELAREWADVERSVTDVTSGSKFEALWQCALGHQWRARVVNRSRGIGCPVCSNKRVLAGYNDLATVSPQLAGEWHPTKNTTDPTEVTPGASTSVWWLCLRLGHEWEAPVKNRTKGTGCPYCSGRLPVPGVSDLVTLAPEVAAQWHPIGNDRGPAEVTVSSSYKALWVCQFGHEWQAKVSHRSRGAGCPHCSGRLPVPGVTDLSSTHPALAAQWHPSANNRQLEDVTAHSHYEAWWRCDEGHEWSRDVGSRARGRGCPYCSGRRPIRGQTDLATLHPNLALQWHPTANDRTPQEVGARSGYRARWLCDVGHEWVAVVSSRSPARGQKGSGCPSCASKRFSSEFENEIAAFVESRGVSVQRHRRDLIKLGRGLQELDIYIPSLELAIEANGVYWHSERVRSDPERHAAKRQACESQGICLITIWEDQWKYSGDEVRLRLDAVLSGTHEVHTTAGDVLEACLDWPVDRAQWELAEELAPRPMYLVGDKRMGQLPEGVEPVRVWDSGWARFHRVAAMAPVA